MNVYGFTDIVFNDEGGASVLIEHKGVTFAVPVVTPEPGQKVSAFSPTGNPAGVIVTQADESYVWVFILHGRLFCTADLNANPHELWLSWAFSHLHNVQRFTGLRKPVPKRVYFPYVVPFEHLTLPAEGESATGNKILDDVMRRNKAPIKATGEKLAVFPDRIYSVPERGGVRRLRGEALATAQALLTAAA